MNFFKSKLKEENMASINTEELERNSRISFLEPPLMVLLYISRISETFYSTIQMNYFVSYRIRRHQYGSSEEAITSI
jgi:hypothetical protein